MIKNLSMRLFVFSICKTIVVNKIPNLFWDFILYGSHMKNKFTPPDIPTWMKREFHGWVEIRMKFEGKEPQYRNRYLML